MKKKEELVRALKDKHDEVVKLSLGGSPATLDHLLKQRQSLIEQLFENYSEQLIDEDIQLFQSILANTQDLEKEIDKERDKKGDELIKHKKTPNRMRLYTRIAQHK